MVSASCFCSHKSYRIASLTHGSVGGYDGEVLSWQLLQDPQYRTYWIALFLSQMGTWMQSAAQGWLVIELTGSAERLGLVIALQFTPALLFSLWAGVISDRYPRRNLLLLTQGFMAVLAAAMAVLILTGTIRYEMVLVFAFLYGTANAIDLPVRQAFTVELAGRERYPGAISLNAFGFNLSRLIGPAVAGLLIAGVGLGWAYFLNALSFVPLLWVLWRYAIEAVEVRTKGVLQELGEGWRYVLSEPLVRQTIVLIGLTSVFGLNLQTLVPSYAKLELNLDAQGYGLLMSAVGIGSIVAALLQAFSPHASPIRALLGSAMLGLGLTLLALPLLPQWVGLVLAFVGLGGITATVNANTTVQMMAPDHIRGRVMSFYSLVLLGSGPLGAYITGLLIDSLGGRGAAGTMGLLLMLSVLALSRLPWPRRLLLDNPTATKPG